MLTIHVQPLLLASQNSLCVCTKITEVTVDRIDGSLGITLRGGLVPDHSISSRPLIITQVRHNGASHRYVKIIFKLNFVFSTDKYDEARHFEYFQ